jgi:hypothetical protein
MSLVNIIRKARGDDIKGAVDDLKRIAGFPEEVAERIATGELPMDEASRVARREAQTDGNTYYHGAEGEGWGTVDPQFVGSTNGNSTGTGLWASSEPDVANSFVADMHDRFNLEDADGVIQPLMYKGSNPRTVEANGEGFSEIYVEDHGLMDTDSIARSAKRDGHDSAIINDVIDFGLFSDEFEKAYEPSTIISMFDGNKVRSPNAAYDPQYKGSNIMGGAAGTAGLAGLLAAGQSEDADAGFITKGGKTLLEAFHGSPHKFDKFSMDQIGTGEGAQAYGHGLYFADVEDVAKGYRDDLKYQLDPREGVNSIVNRMAGEQRGAQVVRDVKTGQTYDYDPNSIIHQQILESGQVELIQGGDSLLEAVAREMAGDKRLAAYSDNREIVSEIANVIRGQEAGGTVSDSAMKSYSKLNQMLLPPEGHLYRTEIDVTPESLLDWDKPLSEQGEAVQEVLGPYKSDFTPSAGGALNLATDALGKGEPERLLSDRGIKGIKYLDGDSRAVGDGTSNYVIFDDSLINIAERGNADPRLLGAAAAGTAGLLAAGQSDDSEASVDDLLDSLLAEAMRVKR